MLWIWLCVCVRRLDQCEAASCTKNVQDAGLIGQGECFGRPAFLWEKRHPNMRRSRVTATDDLEPPEGMGFGLGFRLGLGSGLGLGWSGFTCKVEINDTRPA